MFIKCILIHIFETKYTEYIRFVLNKEKENGKEAMCIKSFCKNICGSHAVFYIMRFVNIHLLSINLDDSQESVYQGLSVFSNALFFYLPKFQWIQRIENKIVLLLFIYGGPAVIGMLGLFGLNLLITGRRWNLNSIGKSSLKLALCITCIQAYALYTHGSVIVVDNPIGYTLLYSVMFFVGWFMLCLVMVAFMRFIKSKKEGGNGI